MSNRMRKLEGLEELEIIPHTQVSCVAFYLECQNGLSQEEKRQYSSLQMGSD